MFEVREHYVPQTPGLGRKIDWAEIENRSVLTI